LGSNPIIASLSLLTSTAVRLRLAHLANLTAPLICGSASVMVAADRRGVRRL
jgi:hypothetical protein